MNQLDITTTIQPVILCGGSGTRLWPLSRSGFPKQFLCLTGNYSLFQQTTQRLNNLDAPDLQLSNPYVVCNEDHRFLVQEQLREIDVTARSIILEPSGRNTAPALTLAALAAIESGTDPILFVTPADQSITNETAFLLAGQHAIKAACDGEIVVLGITPTKAESGYGYIRATEPETNNKATSNRIVQSFTEKPDAYTAQRYLDEGGYYWNAGIFVLKASVWLEALDSFRPDIANSVATAWGERTQDGLFIRPNEDLFEAIPNESVDYAVMEKCPESTYRITMTLLNAGWSDVGAWEALWETLPKDENGNSNLGDILTSESKNNLAYSTGRLISLVGVSNLVVVETPDAVLVANKTMSQEVKAIVQQIKAKKRHEHIRHRKVHRPWGWYDTVDESERFKVKRIQVNPKACLSLQKHYHRAEHWVVVKGTAEVTNGKNTIILTENQSTYIPLGEVHRLSNPGNIPLEIIEIQTGGYLGEDDIVRFDDSYGRVK